MGDAVLGHHAADQQFLDTESGEHLFQRGAVEAVGVFLDHHRGIWCGGEDLGVDAGAGCPGVEEGGDALGGVGDVLHVDDGMPPARALPIAATMLRRVPSVFHSGNSPPGK